MPVVLFYEGLLLALVGVVSLVKPLALLGIRTRRLAVVILFSGLALGVSGAMWPPSLHETVGSHARIDEFLPAYHFHEVHSTRVHAPPARVFRAIREITPREIRFFRTLMAIRELPGRILGGGRPPTLLPGYAVRSDEKEELGEGRKRTIEYSLRAGENPAPATQILQRYEDAIASMGGSVVSRAGCCRSTLKLGNVDAEVWVEIAAEESGQSYRLTIVEQGDMRAADTKPMLDLLTRSGFLVLAEDHDREIVLGEVMRLRRQTGGGSSPRIAAPLDFPSFDAPGYAKIAANFRVEAEGSGWSRVTTETRILATDLSARRVFGVYWRVIYPGSALIRRMWLRAIQRRAEQGP